MLVGKKKGVQYGLVKPAGPGARAAAQAPARKALAAFAEAEDDDQSSAQGVAGDIARQAAKKQKDVKALAAFAEAEDDDQSSAQGVAGDIARQAAKKQKDVKTAQLHAAALADDPSIFDYDGVYEGLQQQRTQPKQTEKVERKSRYIESLLDKTKQRQREQDIVYERRLAKERQAEDHLFGDKDRFVTAAYKQKLQEEQKWLAEEKVREIIEERDDVVKRGHMGDFYRNLMHNNVAFGTAGEKPAKGEASAEAPAEPPAAADSGAEPQSAPEPAAPPQQQGAAAAVAAYKAKKEQGQDAAAKPPELDGGAAAAAAAATSAAGRPQQGQAAAAQPGQPQQEQPAEQPEPPAEEPDRETKAASARERYLARKRKAPDRPTG